MSPVVDAPVRLEPLTPATDARLLAAVLALDPGPDQERYCMPASRTYPPASADPHRVPFAVVLRDGADAGAPVGFGVLDRRGHLEHLLDDPAKGLLLRAFYVDRAQQGRGYGAAGARAARALAHAVEPAAQLLVLCVHTSNAAGLRAYGKAGFVDTGGRWQPRAADPQVVMVAALQPPARRRPGR